ncbi:rhodanese-like domain-containing protein [Enterococcus canintestini]|uniref:rhodanese-like domain-containing protein n=1 Tax=Enterococcus canintestini TaxID=317010 RepID=UPI002891DF59|nr:rhodanese-like domain-containing protein [Enterococcus canintestini]MDT2739183.1 rhodanese-like domain-containing protein [Enterococcus canintestini]
MNKTITNDEFAKLWQAVALVDVREDDEFVAGHIPGAQNIPLSQLESRFKELDKDTHYYVICHSGRRSGLACDFLSQKGYHVTNVLGGMVEWRGEITDGHM